MLPLFLERTDIIPSDSWYSLNSCGAYWLGSASPSNVESFSFSSRLLVDKPILISGYNEHHTLEMYPRTFIPVASRSSYLSQAFFSFFRFENNPSELSIFAKHAELQDNTLFVTSDSGAGEYFIYFIHQRAIVILQSFVKLLTWFGVGLGPWFWWEQILVSDLK